MSMGENTYLDFFYYLFLCNYFLIKFDIYGQKYLCGIVFYIKI